MPVKMLRKLWNFYRWQPLWVQLAFILAIILLAQILTNWSDFLEGISKGLTNYGIDFSPEK